jgi:hypothetical protein
LQVELDREVKQHKQLQTQHTKLQAQLEKANEDTQTLHEQVTALKATCARLEMAVKEHKAKSPSPLKPKAAAVQAAVDAALAKCAATIDGIDARVATLTTDPPSSIPTMVGDVHIHAFLVCWSLLFVCLVVCLWVIPVEVMQ